MKKTVSGESTEDVHEPSLWYYSQMMFIVDQETPRPSISTISEDENDEEKDEENKISFLQPRLAPESSTFPYFIRLFFNC